MMASILADLVTHKSHLSVDALKAT